jgi:hypothetical protein
MPETFERPLAEGTLSSALETFETPEAQGM